MPSVLSTVPALLVSLAAAVPITPTPTPLPYNPDDVTPGVIGFAFTFVIFLAVGLIAWDLVRRVRRMRYRGEVRERLEAEAAASREADESGARSGA